MVFNSEVLGVGGVGGVEVGSMSELLPASDPDRLRWTKLSGSSGSVPIFRLRGGRVLDRNHGSQGPFARKRTKEKLTAVQHVGV
jgi:hypothetical protein